jgi:hypothetical protein
MVFFLRLSIVVVLSINLCAAQQTSNKPAEDSFVNQMFACSCLSPCFVWVGKLVNCDFGCWVKENLGESHEECERLKKDFAKQGDGAVVVASPNSLSSKEQDWTKGCVDDRDSSSSDQQGSSGEESEEDWVDINGKSSEEKDGI